VLLEAGKKCMSNQILFLIGASGAGKTAVAERLESGNSASLKVCYFDRIGVPHMSDMIRDFGSGEEWQRIKTHEWVQSIKNQYLPLSDVLLDGQTRPGFIEEACGASRTTSFRIVLLDCADEVRRARLTKRHQADLATDQMMEWARYLRNDCRRRGLPIVDTTHREIDDVAMSVMQFIGPRNVSG
jgi:dephospho-CoA kinase